MVPIAEGIAHDSRPACPRAPAQHAVVRPEENLGVLPVGERPEAVVRAEVAARPLPRVTHEAEDAVGGGARGQCSRRDRSEGGLIEVRALRARLLVAPRVAARRRGVRTPGGRLLPLEFRGQPPVRETGVRVRLEPGHVHDGQSLVDLLRPVEAALATVVRPVERARDGLLTQPRPALGRPQLAAAVAAGLHELHEVAVRHGKRVDLELRNVDLVPRALVVVREPVESGAGHEGPARDAHHAAGARGATRARPPLTRLVDARLREREGLQHRLGVLVLVLDDHVPDNVAGAAGEHLERTCADGRQVLARAQEVEMRHVAAHGARGLQGVVDAQELGVHRVEPARPHAEPELLERGDVREVPHQRTHQRIVDPVHIRVRDGLDQPQRPRPRLVQEVADPLPGQGFGPSSGRCLGSRGAQIAGRGSTGTTRVTRNRLTLALPVSGLGALALVMARAPGQGARAWDGCGYSLTRSTRKEMRTRARHSSRFWPRRPVDTTSTALMLRSDCRASFSAAFTAPSELSGELPTTSMILVTAISLPPAVAGHEEPTALESATPRARRTCRATPACRAARWES